MGKRDNNTHYAGGFTAPKEKMLGCLWGNVGENEGRINDSEYTELVKKRLQHSLMSIIQFTPAWSAWIIRQGGEHLPPEIGNTGPERLLYLYNKIIEYVHNNRDKLNGTEKFNLWTILISFQLYGNNEYYRIKDLGIFREFIYGPTEK